MSVTTEQSAFNADVWASGSTATPSDYLELLKPRVMSLVVFTALTGMLVAPGHINPVMGAIGLLALAVGAGASGALNMVYDDSLTSSWSTGASHIATVDDSSHTFTLDVNGKKEGTYPVSLGAPDTPTSRGTKVIMEKGNSICMSGPGYHICNVRYTQRLTYGGEYLHAAPWNCEGSPGCTGPEDNIGRADSSNPALSSPSGLPREEVVLDEARAVAQAGAGTPAEHPWARDTIYHIPHPS